MIQLNKVDKVYRRRRMETIALSNINLSVEVGEFVSVMGPSGCGKSTLLNLMGLLDAPTEGDVAIGGERVVNYDDVKLAQLRNEKIGFIFQSFHLISDLSAMDNVEIPLLYRSGLSGRKRREMACEALDAVGLSSRTDFMIAELSGGQQQRVAVARAIVGRPKLILADEPTGNLDSQQGDMIMDILEQLNREHNTTIVMVTHDGRLAERTDRIVRLFDGRQVN